MRTLSIFRSVAVIGAVLVINAIVALVNFQPQASDGRSLQWDRFDVTIDQMDTSANQFHVAEDYVLSVQRGPFSFGFREIPDGRLESISNITVTQDGRQLLNSCSAMSGSYCVTDEGNGYYIKYYFLRSVQSGDTVRISIDYDVYGALRSYDGGDQLWWVAVPSDRSFPARASRVTVVMPDGVPVDRVASYPDTWEQYTSGNTLVWDSPGDLGNNGTVEVRVQYQHDPAMEKPSWQRWFDLQRDYEEYVQPIVSLVMAALGVVLAIGGVIWIVIRYQKSGRDPEALVVPEYLTEPPSDELPGVIGVLLDEKTDMRDIMGTLVDLARRGYLVIEQTSNTGLFGLTGRPNFEFHRTEQSTSDLAEYEHILYKGIFRTSRQSVSLSDLRNKFYKSIPAIKNQMYAEAVNRGYFARSPETTRNYWLFGSIALLVLASVLFWGAHLVASSISPLLIAPPIGLGVVGATGLFFANYMPAKTEKGSQEAAKWRAFRHYLDNITQYGDVDQTAQHFDQYIGYAIAFGLEKDMVHQVVPAMTAMPAWYVPTYIGGPWRGGYYPGRTYTGGRGGDSGGGLGGLDFSGPGGLNSMSESLSQGLNAMSNGMTSMLNDASRVMTSKPSSSGSSHGGGWSGGGGGGGGGSGGGSAGFG